MKSEHFLSKEQLLDLAYTFSKKEGTIFLHSSKDEEAEFSYLFLLPFDQVVLKDPYHLCRKMRGCEEHIYSIENPWDALKQVIDPSLGYWAGFLGYELGAFVEVDKTIPYKSPETPYAYFQRSLYVLKYDHRRCVAYVEFNDSLATEEEKSLIRSIQEKCFSKTYVSNLASIISFDKYAEKIARLKEYILQGEIYQVNLSHPIRIDASIDPFSAFLAITDENPSAFSAYLNIENLSIVSASPERLIKKEGNYLETRPIKGTSPRGKDLEEDTRLQQQLLASPKETSELLMITDLMRNDLGRISEVGSVVVKELFRLESYTNVFHLLSIITSKVKPNLHPMEIMRAIFPGGSITGCPKLRAMEIIHEIEDEARGIYTGSIGYISPNQNFDFNIAIRTLIIHGDKLELRLGGGIVIDSDPLKEYEETLYKGEKFFKVLGIKGVKV